MLAEPGPLLRRYSYRRETIYKDLAQLTVEQLDWQPAQACTTIGTLLLHIGGIEDLKIASMKGFDIHKRWQQSHWDKFRPGFAIELKISGPRGYSIGYYLEILRALQKNTSRYIRTIDQAMLKKSSPFYIEGKDFQPGCFEELQNHALLISILQHEQYHRGQIMLLKFLYKQQHT
jgi:hypothetical protein